MASYRIRITNALGQSRSLAYDSSNRVREVTDRKGQRTTVTYTERGLVASITTPDRSIALAYDALGRLSEVRDSTSVLAYRYDEAGRLVQVDTTTAAGSYRLAYAYDSVDRVTQRTLTLGPGSGSGGSGLAAPELTTYTWDNASRLVAHATVFGPPDLPTTSQTTHRTEYTFDAGNRLASRKSVWGSSGSSGSTSPTLTQRYHYDAADRLGRIEYLQAEGTATEQLLEQIDYRYDARGLRTAKTTLNGHGSGTAETPMQATYDAANRMQTLTLGAGSTATTYALTYDAEGNLTAKQNTANASDRTLYTWDAQNQLTQISQTGGSGHRVR
jgi:YD repeat-containing protein